MKAAAFVIVSLTASLLSGAGGMTWYPHGEWRDGKDPCASRSARRGGSVRMYGAQSPKSYNGYVDNNAYTRMTFSLMYTSLLSIDPVTLDFQPSVARRWAVSHDGKRFVFEIDPAAKWSDAMPLTASDVKWTFDSLMDPASDTGPWKTVLGAFESPVVKDLRTVEFRKKGSSEKDWRDLMNVAFFPVLPRHAFKDGDFNKLDFLNAPVSGPYFLSGIREGVLAEFSRSPAWWRSGAPSASGVYNFDRIVMKYYADNENAFEAFKKGELDVYPVYSARIMAEGVRNSSFAMNHTLRRRVRNHEPIGFQGFAMNMRRAPFDDLGVRKAMAMLVDREMMNRTMMNGEYVMTRSYYSDLYDERNPCRNPVWRYDPDAAGRLLDAAGWKRGADGLRRKDGREFVFTFLSRTAGEDKFLALFDRQLKLQGVTMKIDRKDFAGWMRDMNEYNFDMTWAAWGAGVFRTPETMWHSKSGRERGGNNIVGFASREVDSLIEREKSMMAVADREKAYREIDRLIAQQVPYVLLWHTEENRIVNWNKFGTPASVLGKYGYEESVLAYWWYDDDRARELREAIASDTCLPDVTIRVDYVEDVQDGR